MNDSIPKFALPADNAKFIVIKVHYPKGSKYYVRGAHTFGSHGVAAYMFIDDELNDRSIGFEVLGGGYIYINRKAKTVLLRGNSKNYGTVNEKALDPLISIVKDELPSFEFTNELD